MFLALPITVHPTQPIRVESCLLPSYNTRVSPSPLYLGPKLFFHLTCTIVVPSIQVGNLWNVGGEKREDKEGKLRIFFLRKATVSFPSLLLFPKRVAQKSIASKEYCIWKSSLHFHHSQRSRKFSGALSLGSSKKSKQVEAGKK